MIVLGHFGLFDAHHRRRPTDLFLFLLLFLHRISINVCDQAKEYSACLFAWLGTGDCGMGWFLVQNRMGGLVAGGYLEEQRLRATTIEERLHWRMVRISQTHSETQTQGRASNTTATTACGDPSGQTWNYFNWTMKRRADEGGGNRFTVQEVDEEEVSRPCLHHSLCRVWGLRTTSSSSRAT